MRKYESNFTERGCVGKLKNVASNVVLRTCDIRFWFRIYDLFNEELVFGIKTLMFCVEGEGEKGGRGRRGEGEVVSENNKS